MSTNFDFLKSVDSNLFEIITDAEKLYRAEFFDQCVGQTRRFGEHICRNVLGEKRTKEVTFDEMLATLKDNTKGSEQEKEFLDDLYFLKKHGNNSVHSQKVQKSGMTALECLQRAFEVAINYSVYHKKASCEILKLNYDTELLVTGKESKKTLSQKYLAARDEAVSKSKLKKQPASTKKKSTKPTKPAKSKPQVTSMKSVPRREKFSPYWYFVIFSAFTALLTIIFLYVL